MTKVSVFNSPDSVEVGQYRELNKGSLKAVFSIVIYPSGQKILDCRLFQQGDKRWFKFPEKEVKYSDGRKTEYIPIISYLNKDYLEQLKIAVLQALKDTQPQAPNGKANVQTNQARPNPIQADASADWGEPPF